MGTKRFTTIMMVAAAGVLLLGFQNCAPVGFDMASQAASKAEGLDTPTDDPTDSTTVDDYVNNGDDDPTPKEVEAVCADAKLKAQAEGLVPSEIPSITNSFGKSFDYFKSIGTITNVFGKMVLLGAPGSTVGSIKNTFGRVIICNADIGSIENAFGKYSVGDGSIGSVKNFHGSLRAISTDIGSVENLFGNVRLTDSQITGTRTNVFGNIKQVKK